MLPSYRRYSLVRKLPVIIQFVFFHLDTVSYNTVNTIKAFEIFNHRNFLNLKNLTMQYFYYSNVTVLILVTCTLRSYIILVEGISSEVEVIAVKATR